MRRESRASDARDGICRDLKFIRVKSARRAPKITRQKRALIYALPVGCLLQIIVLKIFKSDLETDLTNQISLSTFPFQM